MNYTLGKEYVLLDSRREVARAVWNGGEWGIVCDHTDIEYGDDDERGECLACGAECDWHWELNESDGREIWVREPHDWHWEKDGALQKLIKREEVYGKKHQDGNNGGEHKETIPRGGEGREH